MRVLVLVVLVLAGCQTTTPTVVVECPFEGPERVVEATTPDAQVWADVTIETGVRVCGWERPK